MTCATCKFCYSEPLPASGRYVYECRRNAPQPGPSSEVSARWPRVRQDDWCGEYQGAVT